MPQVAFLAAMVGPKVAAAAAQRALEVLAEEDPAVAAEAAALQEGAPDAQDRDNKAGGNSAAPGQCCLAYYQMQPAPAPEVVTASACAAFMH